MKWILSSISGLSLALSVLLSCSSAFAGGDDAQLDTAWFHYGQCVGRILEPELRQHVETRASVDAAVAAAEQQCSLGAVLARSRQLGMDDLVVTNATHYTLLQYYYQALGL